MFTLQNDPCLRIEPLIQCVEMLKELYGEFVSFLVEVIVKIMTDLVYVTLSLIHSHSDEITVPTQTFFCVISQPGACVTQYESATSFCSFNIQVTPLPLSMQLYIEDHHV